MSGVPKLEQLNACVHTEKGVVSRYSTGSIVGDEKGFIYHLIQCSYSVMWKKVSFITVYTHSLYYNGLKSHFNS